MATNSSGLAASASGVPHYGVQLPATDARATGAFPIREVAIGAEALGFDGVWVGDHLSFNSPVIESIVAASVAAGVTTRVRVGFGVLVAALRHPVWLAKQLSSLQVVSGDRIELGIGVGGEFAQEWQAAGVPISERGARTNEFLRALPALLDGKTVELGAPWETEVPPLEPAGAPIPLWVGGRSDIALRRAARFDAGWMGVWVDSARVEAARARLEELTATPPRIGVQILVSADPSRKRAEEQLAHYVHGIYRLPLDRIGPYVASGTPDDIAERLATLRDAGASTLILMPTSLSPMDEVEVLAEAVTIARRASAGSATS